MQVVGNQTDHGWQLHAFDLGGGTVCALIVACAAWVAFVHVGKAAHESLDMRTHVESTRQTLSTLEAAALRQESLRETRSKELSERGKLPPAPPVEEYLSAMAAAAAAHQLNVMGHSPGVQRRYGDVVEQCLSFQVSGTAGNLFRFLRSVEESTYWADIGYLRIEGGEAAGAPLSQVRRASLTFSLFAAAAPQPEPNATGGGSTP